MRAEAGVGSRVRTPDPERLCATLAAAGHSCRPTDEGLAVDATPEQVGELAAAQGIVLHALSETGSVEQAFFHPIEQADPAVGAVSAEEMLS